jgi:hypothetical protein
VDTGSGGSAGSGSGGTAGTGGACAGFEPLASVAEVAEAGRDDLDAEVLALRAGSGVVADTALYDRVSSDLSAVRALEPALADVHVWDVFYNWMSLELDAESFAAFESDEYHAWDCANAHYGVSSISVVGVSSVALSFEPKRYRIPLLAEQYEGLEGIASAGVGASGDGPDICLEVDGTDHRYLFDDASGGCGVVCTEHDYSAFEVSMAGVVTPLGSYCLSQTGACDEQEPDWLAPLLDACTPF